MNVDRATYIENGAKALDDIYTVLDSLETLELKSLKPENTALVVMDMVNGFAKAGALYSPRVEALIPAIAELSKACEKWGIVKLAFADTHTGQSPEFDAYPPHCQANTEESLLVDELQAVGRFEVIPKNSTNGFLEPRFREWLCNRPQMDTFIVVGDCTDICVQQFATSLKCSFNRLDRRTRVIVPANGVETFDFGTHNGDLMHTVALMMMRDNGIEVVEKIQV